MGNVAYMFRDDCRPFMRRPCQLAIQNCLGQEDQAYTEDDCADLTNKFWNFYVYMLALQSIVFVVGVVTITKVCTFRNQLLQAILVALIVSCIGDGMQSPWLFDNKP